MNWSDAKALAVIAAYDSASLPRYQAVAAAGGRRQQSEWLRGQAQLASPLTLKVAALLGVTQAQLSLVPLSV
jgi:hypothetical protein